MLRVLLTVPYVVLALVLGLAAIVAALSYAAGRVDTLLKCADAGRVGRKARP